MKILEGSKSKINNTDKMKLLDKLYNQRDKLGQIVNQTEVFSDDNTDDDDYSDEEKSINNFDDKIKKLNYSDINETQFTNTPIPNKTRPIPQSFGSYSSNNKTPELKNDLTNINSFNNTNKFTINNFDDDIPPPPPPYSQSDYLSNHSNFSNNDSDSQSYKSHLSSVSSNISNKINNKNLHDEIKYWKDKYEEIETHSNVSDNEFKTKYNELKQKYKNIKDTVHELKSIKDISQNEMNNRKKYEKDCKKYTEQIEALKVYLLNYRKL